VDRFVRAGVVVDVNIAQLRCLRADFLDREAPSSSAGPSRSQACVYEMAVTSGRSQPIRQIMRVEARARARRVARMWISWARWRGGTTAWLAGGGSDNQRCGERKFPFIDHLHTPRRRINPLDGAKDMPSPALLARGWPVKSEVSHSRPCLAGAQLN